MNMYMCICVSCSLWFFCSLPVQNIAPLYESLCPQTCLRMRRRCSLRSLAVLPGPCQQNFTKSRLIWNFRLEFPQDQIRGPRVAPAPNADHPAVQALAVLQEDHSADAVPCP